MTRIGIIGSPQASGISSARLLLECSRYIREQREQWELVQAISPAPGRLDLLVIYEASPLKVLRALEMWPRAAILAVLPLHGEDGDVVAVLDAGAEACVRTPHTRVVMGHLQALERRRSALLHATPAVV